MKRTLMKCAATAAGALIAAGCATYPDPEATHRLAEKMVSEGFTASPSHAGRLAQDRSQQICSKIGDARLTQEEAAEVVRLARASFKYPASGRLVGDWKRGEKLAHDGAGDRIRRGKLE